MSALLVEEENKKINNSSEEETMENQPLKKQKVVSFCLPPPPPPAASDETEGEAEEETVEPTLILSANDCIRLVFVDFLPETKEFVYHSFRPEFTHQLFENEQISLPMPSATLTEGQAPHLLTVFIRCSDLVHTVVIGNSTMFPSNSAPEILVMDQLKTGLPDDSTTSIINNETSSGSETCAGQMALSASFLDPNMFHSPSDSLDALGTYRSTVAVDESCRYELYLANDKDVPTSWSFLRRAERVAMWHIETADAVDFSDERWEVINLYKCGPTDCTYRSLAGYITLFTFLNPFKGLKMRVCQALVLPHVQKKGLGREMLLGVYRLAAERANVCEVTVEDPCPGFERMRDTVDCEWLLLALPKSESAERLEASSGSSPVSSAAESWLQLLTEQDRSTYPKVLKLTPGQTNFAFEAVQYTLLQQQQQQQQSAEAGESEEDDQQARQFRLQVKRRLLGENVHIKSGGKEAMQKELEALYSEIVERFERCTKHCARVMRQLDSPQQPQV